MIMKGYKTNHIPTTYTIGLLEAIENEEIRKKAIHNFNEKIAINNEKLYGGAATISKALEYAFYWDESPEGNDYWEKIHAEHKIKRI